MSPKKKKEKKKSKKKTVNDAKKAAAVVAQVLVHFGAGWGPTNSQIFRAPKDIAQFSKLLMKHTMNNFKRIRWEKDAANRDGICAVANLHGQLARKVAGTRKLTWPVIERTLKQVKAKHCPGGAGGGLVCDS